MAFIKLAIIEDDSTIRESVATYLGRQPEIEVVYAAGTVEEFLHMLPRLATPDLIILDIGLPGMSGLQGIVAIHEKAPDTDILILSAFDDQERVFQALCSGAVGYLTKRAALPEIKEAVLTVAQGGSTMSPEIARKVINNMVARPRRKAVAAASLTPRQNEIVQGLVDGLSYKMIADKLEISVETVRDHIKKIYKKLQVNSKAEVIRKMMRGDL